MLKGKKRNFEKVSQTRDRDSQDNLAKYERNIQS